MRRLSAICLMLLLLAAGLFAEDGAVAMRFKLLEAEFYTLDSYYSSELGRLYTKAEFAIPKAELDPMAYYGLFLEENTFIQSVTVSGQFENHYFVQNLDPSFFEPALPDSSLLYDTSPVRFYGIYLKNYDLFPDTPHFTVWYFTPMPAFRLDDQQKLSSMLKADQCWYPRNLTKSSTVNLTLTTTPNLTLLVGNSYATHSDSEYTRTHRHTFIDTLEQPVDLKLIRE